MKVRSGMVKPSLMALGAALVIGGCSDADPLSQVKEFVAQVKARPGGRVDPLPEIAQVETFVYVPGDRRNPFVPTKEPGEEQVAGNASGIAPDRTRRKEELESFPLDSLAMVGTLDKDGVKWGLIRNAEGMLYRVRSGNYMGQNHGQIIEITDLQIKLSEILADGQGGYRENPASVALSE